MYTLISEVKIQTNAISEIRTKPTKAGLVVSAIVLENTPVTADIYTHICIDLCCVVPVIFPNNTIVMDFTQAIGDEKVIFDGEDTFKTYLKVSED